MILDIINRKFSTSNILILDHFESRMNFIWVLSINNDQFILKCKKTMNSRSYNGDIWASANLTILNKMNWIPEVVVSWKYNNNQLILFKMIFGSTPNLEDLDIAYLLGEKIFLIHNLNKCNFINHPPYIQNKYRNWNNFINKELNMVNEQLKQKYKDIKNLTKDLYLPSNNLSTQLIHGDIHHENILSANGKITGIIDWDLVCIGDPMWDFGTIWAIDNEPWLIEVIKGYINSGGKIDFEKIRKYGLIRLLDIIAMLNRASLNTNAEEVMGKYIQKANEDITHLEYFL